MHAVRSMRRTREFSTIPKVRSALIGPAMNKPSCPDELLENDLGPNDGSSMSRTAGRDEASNATTDLQHPLESGESVDRYRRHRSETFEP